METHSNPNEKTHAKCTICNSELHGRQSKFCSLKCKNRDTNNRNQNYDSQQSRGAKRKNALVKLFGGKCDVCGYNRNYAALTFHHLRDKKFPLDIRHCSNRSWDNLLSESEKCRLLCIRCHVELHNPDFFV